ncbi:hypothetical protein HQ560_07950, partial [bacterium]|nr:hypothetical protein [bacterium]
MSRLRILSLVVLGAVPFLMGTAWGEPSQRFAAWPDEVVEGRAFEVTVAFDVPAKLRTVKLHCELKSPDNSVLQRATALARGRGSHVFRLKAPDRSKAQRIRLAIWMGEDWTHALAGVTHTEAILVIDRRAQADRKRAQTAAPALLRSLGHKRSEGGNIAVFVDPAFGASVAAAASLERVMPKGPAVTHLDAAALSNPFVLTVDRFDVLVLPDARTVPADAVRPILGFLRRGGDLVAIGTPAFERRMFRIGDRWLDDAGIRDLVRDTPPARMLYAFDADDVRGWRRTTDAPESKATYDIAPDGKKGSCLRARIPSLTGWDTFHSPRLDRPFPAGHTLTCFWAKGSARTRQLAVEWVERDGSRWIATVPLTTAWQPYALAPSAFRYWQDSPTPTRGGVGDAFRPAQAASLAIGLAFTHTGQVEGEHAWWVDELGTAPNPHAELVERLATGDAMPPLDTLCPGYKFFPVRSAESFAFGEALPKLQHAFAPASARSSHVRPRATGFDKNRPWRWEPLVVAADKTGRRCGFPATLLVHAKGTYAGGVWAAFSYAPENLPPAVGACVGETLKRMQRGLWLLEGGASDSACFPGQEFTVGARAANFSSRPADVRVRLSLASAGQPLTRQFSGAVEPGQTRAWSFPCSFDKGKWRVTATLEHDGETLDRLAHDLHIWSPPKAPDFVTTQGGDFIARGKPWRPHGVNYMPSSGMAIEDPA